MTGVASSGVVAEEMLGRACEDTITLAAQWENITDGSMGHATYTASWTAAKADVHSQQRFFCLMSGGEVTADQVNTISGVIILYPGAILLDFSHFLSKFRKPHDDVLYTARYLS